MRKIQREAHFEIPMDRDSVEKRIWEEESRHRVYQNSGLVASRAPETRMAGVVILGIGVEEVQEAHSEY